ncbi:MAG TPA: BrxA/BrxB family bacilliredoxin, partial [Allomuricauda sp.]|nr:BrxA/BrxB family bacilliredoxin [Allomuricauda sp.]
NKALSNVKGDEKTLTIPYLCTIIKKKSMYPEELVKPMREDLASAGFEELHTSEAVNEALKKDGTTLVVVNSVCGCAAANARPAAKLSLQNSKTPNNLVTVFAGVDMEAVATARNHMVPFPPSSPSMALFKDGELVHMIERHHIEGRPAELIAENLIEAYNEHC